MRGLLLYCLVGCYFAIVSTNSLSDYPYHVDLDPNYKLYWNFNDTHITFETVVKTAGYVAFGISGNGNMYPADVVIGWVKDGTPHFMDAHNVAKSPPLKDAQQDWHLISASETSGTTTLKFIRKLQTCDDDDMPILDGTTRVIFSYHPDDPVNEQTLPYHGYNRRGGKSLLLLDPPASESKLKPQPSSILTFDIVNNNFSVPAADTHYNCRTFQMPPLGGKRHIIRYEPIIQKGHEKIVHHFVVRYCFNKMDASLVDKDFDCYNSQPPQLANCYGILMAWAVGGQAFDFPDHVGYPLGTDLDPDFFILETHYDNQLMRGDYVDSSGVRLIMTSEIRQHDAAVMELGAGVDTSQVIPAFTKEMMSVNYCSPSCLAKAMGDQNMNVFATLLHSHLIGRAITARVVRGDQELPPLAQDNNYDFNYQEMRILKDEYVLKKGDNIITECLYKAPHKNTTTFGGLSTNNEMCITFAMYYPRTPKVTTCLSRTLYKMPPPYQYHETERWVNENFDWTQQSEHDRFQNLTEEAPVQVMCLGPNSDYTDPGIFQYFTRAGLDPKVPYNPPRVCP